MASCDEDDDCKKENVHWICGNTPFVDPEMKLNLVEFYKIVGRGESSCSCVVDSDVDVGGRLLFKVKGPYTHQQRAPCASRSEQQPKCLAVDLFFEDPARVAVIRFQNYYVAHLSVLAKILGYPSWQTLIRHRTLMPTSHHQTGSRAHFELKPVDSENWTKITELRFLLVQPSSCWKKFNLEQLSVYEECGVDSSTLGSGRNEPRNKSNGNYLDHLMQKTEEALRMECQNETRTPATSSTGTIINTSNIIPFYVRVGTSGYEIEKLPSS